MVGVDTDEISLKYGLSISRLLNVIKSNIQSLPFRNNSFDLILCSSVIHEIKKISGRSKAIREFHRVLKLDGALCIIDVFTANPIIDVITHILQYVTSKVEWIFPKAQLDRILDENDFTTVSSEKTQSRLLGAIDGYIITTRKS
jgi:ubiquinone/menaquinone biosynthesis C-methylase UbiE